MEALLDTGNLAGGFISEKIRPNLDGLIIQCTVCSGLDNSCYSVNIKLVLRVTYYYEILNKNDTFDIDANIFKEAPIDIIIGRNTIKKYRLFDKIPSQILSYGPSQTDVNNVSEVRRPPECQLQGHLKWSPSTVPVKTVSVR